MFLMAETEIGRTAISGSTRLTPVVRAIVRYFRIMRNKEGAYDRKI